jgi:hypothetical protein
MYADLLAALSAVPERAAALRPDDRPLTVPPGEWPPHVVIGHLAHVEAQVWQPRLHQMAVEDVPRWPWTEPQDLAWLQRCVPRSWDDVLAEFTAARTATVDYLRALPPEGWQRRGLHAVFGELDVAGLCREILVHDEEHLKQAARVTVS